VPVFAYTKHVKQSELFTKTLREAPHDDISVNAQLLARGGFIYKEMAGVYAYLPLGFRVLRKIEQIVREEMNALGGQELIMTSLQRKELWETTDRWDDKSVDVWFKSKLHAGGEVGFAWSHEEPIATMMKNHIESFRDLPVYVYQFQTKLRNELRAKSGIIRGREFVMNDMYSFSLGQEDHDAFYNAAIEAYKNVYRRVGIGEDTFVTFASGGAFTKFSHEFQTITEAGEDVIYINRHKNIAINEEVLNEQTLKSLGIERGDLEKVKTAEVGNIFNFGTKKSEDLGLWYSSKNDEKIPVWLGSYGIGITRLMGVLVEKFADERGIIWPEAVAPFRAHVIVLDDKNAEAERVVSLLEEAGIEVLYDDRSHKTAGEKFADADLIGIPYRIVVSKRASEKGGYEIKRRNEEKAHIAEMEEIIRQCSS